MPQVTRVCSNRRKKFQVLPRSSVKVTTNKVRECFARRNTINNSKEIALNKNITVKNFLKDLFIAIRSFAARNVGHITIFQTSELFRIKK